MLADGCRVIRAGLAARGGQVVVPAAGLLPTGAWLADLGLAAVFPPLRSLDSPKC
jgi:hypothetical protein